jgi:hypothetical protein
MHLRITKSGGLAGFDKEEVAVVDTHDLGPDAARRVRDCIEALERETPPVGADLIRYDVHVRDDEGNVRELATLDEGDPSSTLHRLLGALGASP